MKDLQNVDKFNNIKVQQLKINGSELLAEGFKFSFLLAGVYILSGTRYCTSIHFTLVYLFVYIPQGYMAVLNCYYL